MFSSSKLIARSCTSLVKWSQFSKIYPVRRYGAYEPDYLEAMKSKIPLYTTLNIQLKGYDYPVLENYQKYVSKIVSCLDIDFENGWAIPAKKIKVERFKPRTSSAETEYTLKIYERNVQISDVESTSVPLLLQFLAATLPEGVDLQIHEHLPEHEEERYVPDHELIALKDQLETMTTKKK